MEKGQLAITDKAGMENISIHITEFWENTNRIINAFKNFNLVNITTETNSIYPQFTLFYNSVEFDNGYESHSFKIPDSFDIHSIAKIMLSLIDRVDLAPSQRMSIKSCLKM